jgi:hypothetical protein
MSLPRFQEEQRFPGPLRFLRMVTEVDERCLRVRLSSLLSPFSREVPLTEVDAVETHADLSKHVPGMIRYWLMGVQILPGVGWAINPGSRRGVTVRIAGGRRLVIGSRRPQELAGALASATATGGYR